jgi:hypothetical protein
LVDIGFGLFSPRGSATSSVLPVATSSPSQAPTIGASASAEASLAPSLNPVSLLPERTPLPIPETGADLSWERVATFGGAPNVFVWDLAKGPGGYVAVGERIDGVITELGNEGPVTPLLWRSTDGIRWTAGSATAFGSGFATTITGNSAEYLAVVQQDPTTHLYRSVDGLDWQAVADPPGVSGGYMRKVIVGPKGFVAIGNVGPPGYTTAFWSSPNGSDWTLVHEETDRSEVLDVVAGTKGVVAVGIAQPDQAGPVSEAVWYSADGVNWLRDDPTPAGGILEAVAATSDGFFAAGWLDPIGIAMWRSADGMTWTPLPAGAALGPDYSGDSGSAGGAFSFAGREYVSGYASCCGFPFQHSYVSADGTHWSRVHRDAAFAPVHLRAVIVEDSRVVAAGNVLGSGGLGETGGIWIGRKS